MIMEFLLSRLPTQTFSSPTLVTLPRQKRACTEMKINSKTDTDPLFGVAFRVVINLIFTSRLEDFVRFCQQNVAAQIAANTLANDSDSSLVSPRVSVSDNHSSCEGNGRKAKSKASKHTKQRSRQRQRQRESLRQQGLIEKNDFHRFIEL